MFTLRTRGTQRITLLAVWHTPFFSVLATPKQLSWCDSKRVQGAEAVEEFRGVYLLYRFVWKAGGISPRQSGAGYFSPGCWNKEEKRKQP